MKFKVNQGQPNEVERLDRGVYAYKMGGDITAYWFCDEFGVNEAKRYLKDRGVNWKRLKVNDMEKETRLLNTEFRVETRDEKVMVRGIAAVFNSLSDDLGGFRERIDPAAFDGVIGDDVRALKNHNPDWVLGRTKAGTLQLRVKPEGLEYEYSDPDTTYSRDLIKSMTRGDITQSSFAFRVLDDKWEKVDGEMIRTITAFERLYDVSPVTYPAYPDTTVAKRSLDQMQHDEDDHNLEVQRIAAEEEEREIQLRELVLSDINTN